MVRIPLENVSLVIGFLTLAHSAASAQMGGPVADFSADPTCGLAPLTVQFTDQSLGQPISWSWQFGDTATSTEKNPEHTYTTSGQFDVTLQIVNALGQSNTIKKTAFIDTSPVPGAAGTTCVSSPTNVDSFMTNAPIIGQSWTGMLDVSKHDAIPSANPVKNIALMFGTSLQAIPVPHTYSFCTALLINDIVDAKGCDLSGGCYVGGIVTRSFDVPNDCGWIGAVVYAQGFAQHKEADGSFDPNTSRPSWSNAMELTVGTFDPNGGAFYGCGPPAIVPGCVFADFTYAQVSGTYTVDFTDTSTGPGTISSWLWDFGDGATSTLQNPTHTYSNSGEKTVTLTVSNGYDADTTDKTFFVQ